MTTDTRTSVMLVDDHQVMRDLLRDALENTGEFQVVAQAADGEEALRLVEEAAPDVIVMDVIMPELDGIEACRQITELLPGTRVLMLTASNEKDAIVQVHRRRGHRVSSEVFRQGAAAHDAAGGGPGRVPHPGGRGPAAGPGGAQPVGRRRGRAAGGSHQPREGYTEAVRRGAVLPGDRRDQEQQRPHRAQRRVGRPEEAGVQDQAADGGVGGARRSGGRRLSVIPVSRVLERKNSWGIGKTRCWKHGLGATALAGVPRPSTEAGWQTENLVADAAGPETFTIEEQQPC